MQQMWQDLPGVERGEFLVEDGRSAGPGLGPLAISHSQSSRLGKPPLESQCLVIVHVSVAFF